MNTAPHLTGALPMFHFSIFVFGRLSRMTSPVTQERLDELIQWAVDNEWSWSVTMAD